MIQESLFTPVGPLGKDRLHLRHIGDGEGEPALLVHGSIENGRIFYTTTGKGLAPFLAERGFDTYVPDLRGRGLSEPRMSRTMTYGMWEAICEDVPALVRAIRERRGRPASVWIAHSWGGVLLLSAFARFPELREGVRGMLFFGTKRSIHVSGLQKWINIDFFWNRFGPALASVVGYLPARELHVGGDNEPRRYLSETIPWVKPGPWIDPRDGFDYMAAIRKTELPPTLFLAGTEDRYLGNPIDVRKTIDELASARAAYHELPGYGHIDMLTGPRVREDHFGFCAAWLREKSEMGILPKNGS